MDTVRFKAGQKKKSGERKGGDAEELKRRNVGWILSKHVMYMHV